MCSFLLYGLYLRYKSAAGFVVSVNDMLRVGKLVPDRPNCSCTQWRIQKLCRDGGRKTKYQPRRHLSQIHTTNYMLYGEKRLTEKIMCQ